MGDGGVVDMLGRAPELGDFGACELVEWPCGVDGCGVALEVERARTWDRWRPPLCEVHQAEHDRRVLEASSAWVRCSGCGRGRCVPLLEWRELEPHPFGQVEVCEGCAAEGVELGPAPAYPAVPRRRVRHVWIGDGPDPLADQGYREDPCRIDPATGCPRRVCDADPRWYELE